MLHQDSNDSGVRIVNSATSKISTFPDGKICGQIDHTFIDRRWHSIVLDVRSFRGVDGDTNHCTMVATVRERLAVCKQAARKFDVKDLFSKN